MDETVYLQLSVHLVAQVVPDCEKSRLLRSVTEVPLRFLEDPMIHRLHQHLLVAAVVGSQMPFKVCWLSVNKKSAAVVCIPFQIVYYIAR